MTENDQKRKKIFDVYSENFELLRKSQNWNVTLSESGKVRSLNEKVYVCPICRLAFTEKNLDQSVDNCLTLEDAPPKKLGGKSNILTCKNCNNKSGQKLDVQLKTHVDSQQVFKKAKVASIPASFKVGNSSIKGTFASNENKEFELFIDHNSNPNAKKDIESLIENWSNSKFNMSLKLENQKFFKIAILRVAHLIAFQHLGYSYLYNESINKICNQILFPKEEFLNYIPVLDIEIPENFAGLNLIRNPIEFSTFLITFIVKHKKTGFKKIFSCPIPGPGLDGWKAYENFSNLKKKTKFDITHINTTHRMLTDELFIYDYFRIWKEFRNGS